MGKTPKAVEDAAKRSEELSEELARKLRGEEEVEEVELDAAPEIEEDDSDETEDPVLAEGSTDEEDDDEIETSPPKEDWEHKYAVLQGKYNREINMLRNELAKMRQDMEAKPKAETPKAEPVVRPTINPQDYEEYGDEFVKLADIIKQLSTENERLQQEVSSVSSNQKEIETSNLDNAVKVFYAELGRVCPEWERINVDPNFMTWLAEPADQFSGNTKQNILDQATTAGDASKVGMIFNTFKDAFYTKKKPVKTPTLEEQVPPKTRPNQNVPRPKVEGKVWTTQDIKDLYSDITAGRYRHNPEQAKKLEQDLFAAQREGRIAR